MQIEEVYGELLLERDDPLPDKEVIKLALDLYSDPCTTCSNGPCG